MKPNNHQREICGELLINRDFGNFALLESLYPPGATMPRHTHEIAHVSVVLQGTFTEVSGRKRRISGASTLIIHPPDEDHEVTFHGSGARVFSVHIKPQLHERIRDFTKILDVPAALQGGDPAWLAVELYRESKTLDEVTPLMLEGIALEIVAAASRRSSSLREGSIPLWLERAREYLHANFTNKISIDVLAELVGVHPAHLARGFRRAFGCAMGEYVRRLRIEAACRELSDSDLSLNEIALGAGFYDQSHFSNVFKRLTGVTPAQYRAIFRQR